MLGHSPTAESPQARGLRHGRGAARSQLTLQAVPVGREPYDVCSGGDSGIAMFVRERASATARRAGPLARVAGARRVRRGDRGTAPARAAIS
eukprot:3558619-Prymnesium_polylepis.1